MTTTVLEFWLSSLDMREYYQTFIDNGYDDLEICKKIGASDLTAMGVFRPEHRARLLLAVSELLSGATQVYIRAASLNWRILREEDKRDIPTNLLRKMVRMKLRSEGVHVGEMWERQLEVEVLPLELVYLCHRYSLALNTRQDRLEEVVQEILREELDKQSHYQNFPTNLASSPSCSYFPPVQHRLNSLVTSRSFTAQKNNSDSWYQVVQPRKSRLASSRSSDCSLSSSSPATSSSDYEYPRISFLSSARLKTKDNGVAPSSSVDSLSCLQSGFKMRQNNPCGSVETSGDTFKKQFDRVKSQSKLVNSGKIYCVDSHLQKMW